MLMTMLCHLKLPEKIYSVNARGAHTILGYHDAKLFETPRKTNHSVTAPIFHILFFNDDSQSFETLPKKSQYHCTKCP